MTTNFYSFCIQIGEQAICFFLTQCEKKLESKVYFCFAFFRVPDKCRAISRKSFYSIKIPETKKGKTLLKVVYLKYNFLE